jgi:hypothetical protein
MNHFITLVGCRPRGGKVSQTQLMGGTQRFFGTLSEFQFTNYKKKQIGHRSGLDDRRTGFESCHIVPFRQFYFCNLKCIVWAVVLRFVNE